MDEHSIWGTSMRKLEVSAASSPCKIPTLSLNTLKMLPDYYYLCIPPEDLGGQNNKHGYWLLQSPNSRSVGFYDVWGVIIIIVVLEALKLWLLLTIRQRGRAGFTLICLDRWCKQGRRSLLLLFYSSKFFNAGTTNPVALLPQAKYCKFCNTFPSRQPMNIDLQKIIFLSTKK